MTSDGRIASGPIMFSHAARTPVTLTRRLELGDRAHRGEHRRAAGHVALLAHDVGLRLEEVAAGVEGHGLADEREVRARGASAGSWRRTMSRGGAVLERPTAASAGRPAAAASRTSTRRPGIAAARSARPAGPMTFGGASTSSRATFVQRATTSGRLAAPANSSLDPADDEALDGGLARLALPAARRRSCRARRPRRAACSWRSSAIGSVSSSAQATRGRPAAGAHGPGRRGPQVLRVEPVRRDEDDPPRAQLAADLDDRDRVRVRRRARQPPLEQRVELADEQAARGEREGVGLDLGRGGGGDLDVHRASGSAWAGAGGHRLFLSSVGARSRSSAPPPAAASRSGTAAARPARRPARGAAHAADAVVDRDPRRRGPVAPRQRVAGPAPAARGVRRRTRGRRSRRAGRRRAAHRRGDRPHRRACCCCASPRRRSGCTAASRCAAR